VSAQARAGEVIRPVPVEAVEEEFLHGPEYVRET
jgi:hypothetical protein